MSKLQTFSGTASLPSFQQYKKERTNQFLASLHYETRDRYNPSKQKAEFQNGYVDYLNKQDWNYFVTGTTGYSLSIPSARRLAERYFEKISSSGDKIFFVSEPFECKDGNHIHALLKTDTHFGALVDLWQVATGNKATSVSDTGKITWETWNRIELKTYNKRIGAGGYVSKYILKKRADYDLFFKA